MKQKHSETNSSNASQFFDEYWKKFTKEREKAQNLVSNNEYMLWLEKFSFTYTDFSDDSWIYRPEKLCAEDLEKVNSLRLFFEGLEGYALKNFLPIYHDEEGTYVLIKFNDIGYQIGVVHCQGIFNYCSRVVISSDKVFIDFNDVMTNKKQENVDFITQKLEDLSKLIDEMISSGVPVTNISATVKSALDKYED